ncbi:MAG: hypothetical protein WC872_00065 [Candidatus Absconditabacterales bacterium]
MYVLKYYQIFMFFAILGKNNQISLEELKSINPKNYKEVSDFIITFDDVDKNKLSNLGGIIKWGRVINKNELTAELQNVKIIGVADESFGKLCKKQFGLKRFKVVDLFHTDKEVKEKGKEIIKLGSDYGIVNGYQNINLYEKVDFSKPFRDMKVGMMPAKLTHILINIGLTNLDKNKPILIYDPFAGSGTTGFISNFLGYDFLASDIDINHVEKNYKRRKITKFYNKQKEFKIFQQDITKKINSDILNSLKNHQVLIVSEGWLGPIVRQDTSYSQIDKFQDKVWNVYKNFIENLNEIKEIKSLVFTIPYYIGKDNSLESDIQNLAEKLKIKFYSIPEIYKREKQNLGRKIIILSR